MRSGFRCDIMEKNCVAGSKLPASFRRVTSSVLRRLATMAIVRPNSSSCNCPACCNPMDPRGQQWYYCAHCNQMRRERTPRPAYINRSGRTCYVLTHDEKRDQNYRKNYGITLVQYNEMLEAQGGRCAACRQKETTCDPRTKMLKNLCVDHDHDTGKVRGLLCSGCNSALGHLKESPARTRGILAYIKRIKQSQRRVSQLSLFD